MKDGLTQVKELKDKIHEQHFEIERLNNIINELEKWLVEWREMLLVYFIF